jgi:hypothetical protein
LLHRVYAKWFPELARFESEKEREDAFATAAGKTTWKGLPVVLLVFATPVLAANILDSIAPRWATWLVSVAAGLAMGVLATWVFRHETRRRLRIRLINLGVPICLHCGYDLRGQTVPRCPECGKPFNRRLIPTEGKREDEAS